MIGSEQTPDGGPEATQATTEPALAATSDAPVSPTPVAAGAPPAGSRPPGAIRRTWEWFWRGRAMADLRKQGTAGSARGAELLRRGWLALDVAKRTLDPPERFPVGRPDAVAWELSRQAVYWGLRAERALAGTDDPALSLDSMVQEARPRLVAAAGSEAEVTSLEPGLSRGTLAEQSELAPDEQSRSAHAMFRLARALLSDLEQPRVRLDRLWFQRLWRCGGLVTLLLLVGLGAAVVNGLVRQSRDVAHGKPWKSSSASGGTTSCPSPTQDCAESPFFFFHTHDEEKPWLEIDLGSKQRIVGARIENREDCCADRTVPLAILVSTDHKTWKEVVRRTEVFGTWSPSFAPVNARWVRVQVMRRSMLHLHRVSFYR